MSLAQIVKISCDTPRCGETFAVAGVGRVEARQPGEGRRLVAGAEDRGWASRRPLPAPTRPILTLPCADGSEPLTGPAGALAGGAALSPEPDVVALAPTGWGCWGLRAARTTSLTQVPGASPSPSAPPSAAPAFWRSRGRGVTAVSGPAGCG